MTRPTYQRRGPEIAAGHHRPGGSLAALDLRHCCLDLGDFSRCDFTGADLRGVSAKLAVLTNAKFVYALVSDVRFEGAVMHQAHMVRINGWNVVLTEADLYGASLNMARLQRADFRGADLRDANLQFATLPWADFRGADLRGADFRHANLREAAFTGARRHGAHFENAVF